MSANKKAAKKGTAKKVAGTKAVKKAAKKATKKKAAKTTTAKKPAVSKAAKKKASAKSQPTAPSALPQPFVSRANKSKPAPVIEIGPAELEFIEAIDKYKFEYGRPFPSWSEILHVLRGLGYTQK